MIYNEGALGKIVDSVTTIKKKPISPANGIVASFSCFPFDIKKKTNENTIAPTNKMRKVIVGNPIAKA